jgi:hypothetical protein
LVTRVHLYRLQVAAAVVHHLPVAAVVHLLLAAAVVHHLPVVAVVHHLPVVAELHLPWVYPNQVRQYCFWWGWVPQLCGRVANEKRVKLYSVNSNFY